MSASVQCKTTRANPIYKQTLKIRFSFPLATWIEAIPFFFVELNRHIAYTQKLSLLSGKSGIEIIHWIEAEYNWICETFTETAKRLECVIIVTRHRFTDPRTNAHQDILMIKHNPSGQKHTNELRYGFNRFTTICILFGFVWCGLIVKSVLYVCAAMWITLKSSLFECSSLGWSLGLEALCIISCYRHNEQLLYVWKCRSFCPNTVSV